MNTHLLRWTLTLLLASPPLLVAAETNSPSPLPPLGNTWQDTNPYRNDAGIAQQGQRLYNQHCARCHGLDATAHGPAPKLRHLDSTCRRVKDPALQTRCLADVDYFFKTSVLEGKRRVGVEHMPPWQGVLSQEEIWAIRTFVAMPSR